MKVRDIINLLDAELLVEGNYLDLDVQSACGSDLMSDVMAYVKENVLLLTGLINPQVVRTAEMMDIKVIIFVRGKRPTECMVNLASEKGIILMSTKHHMFTACGKLYSAGISGGSV